MTEARCAQVRDLAAGVALGLAGVEDRALVLGHVTSCADCRSYLAELSGVVDDVLTLVPPAEPPTGFESTVLARYDDTGRARPSRSPLRRMLGLAAVLLLVAAVSGGAVYWNDRQDREVASGLRETLKTANGQYFVAFPLRDLGAVQRGAVFAYQGDPAWVFLTLDRPLPAGRYGVELVTRDGSARRIADGLDLSGSRGWGVAIPVAVHDAALVRVLDDDGRLVLSARLPRR